MLPEPVRELGGLLLAQVAEIEVKIAGLETDLNACARQDEEAARLMTIPGIGPVTAMALQAFAPPMEGFQRGHGFSAWLGLVPLQHTTGGKPRLGKTSKMGQRDLRRLLITGAMTMVRWAAQRGATIDPWLARMLARKPRMLIAVALANRMARIVWALMTKRESYRVPAAAQNAEDAGAVGSRHCGDLVRWSLRQEIKPAPGSEHTPKAGLASPASLLSDVLIAESSPYCWLVPRNEIKNQRHSTNIDTTLVAVR